MGTRCGDLDPSIVTLLAEKLDVGLDKVTEILNKESGVLGISGVSSDFRDLEASMDEGNKRFCFSFFECQLYSPPVFVNQSDFFGCYLPVVGDKLVFPAFFVLVINQTQTKSLFFFPRL